MTRYEPTMREALQEYVTVQRGLIESTQQILHIVSGRPGTDAELFTRAELAANMKFLGVVCDDLEKILRGEELELTIREFRL